MCRLVRRPDAILLPTCRAGSVRMHFHALFMCGLPAAGVDLYSVTVDNCNTELVPGQVQRVAPISRGKSGRGMPRRHSAPHPPASNTGLDDDGIAAAAAATMAMLAAQQADAPMPLVSACST